MELDVVSQVDTMLRHGWLVRMIEPYMPMVLFQPGVYQTASLFTVNLITFTWVPSPRSSFIGRRKLWGLLRRRTQIQSLSFVMSGCTSATLAGCCSRRSMKSVGLPLRKVSVVSFSRSRSTWDSVFGPEGGSDIFLRRVSRLSPGHTALYVKILHSYRCENLRFNINYTYCLKVYQWSQKRISGIFHTPSLLYVTWIFYYLVSP
jgi:hypothetical protein